MDVSATITNTTTSTFDVAAIFGIKGCQGLLCKVQTTSQVDILDDGYLWRMYGQKVVERRSKPKVSFSVICISSLCFLRKPNRVLALVLLHH
jgi:hypothetical protein